jgi:hypothetical protein
MKNQRILFLGRKGTGKQTKKKYQDVFHSPGRISMLKLHSKKAEGCKIRIPGFSEKSAEKSIGSACPYQGSMQTKGAPGFDQIPRNGKPAK